MFYTYLRRELAGRRKQTAIVAIGMALAIALVIIVNSVSSGVQLAQASVLESVYGVGTDITVSQAPAAAATPGTGNGAPQRFDFGSADGAAAGGTTTISRSRLTAERGTETFASTSLDSVRSVPNVSAAAATLLLSNSTFSGALPTRTQGGTRPSAGQTPPTGGPDGAGGSSFSVDSFTVLGLNPADAAVGPLSAVTLTAGRSLASTDAGAHVAVLDASYATTASLAVGGTVAIAGTDFSIVGLVSAATADSATAANVYIPLDVAQTLAALPGQVSNIYVQAASSTNISQVQADIRTALPAATVKTQADLASSVSGSLASASSLVSNLGLWLSLIVLAAAFLIAILFTISGVTRRTREFGTLKAIGWSNGRIVRQVGGESLVQGLIGGVVGIVVGLAGILVINIIAPTLTAGASTAVQAAGRGARAAGGAGGAGGAGFGPGGGGFGAATQAAAESNIVLTAPVTVSVILVAVGLAVLGGLLAGVIGGWRASRLRPAEALRSIA
ncbi:MULTISPECIES: ABC transporter permease [unclassified Cryobacterium]|jgi:putative ABC transport system permease protein|uniref:ABC transporter permease n=1 Tax=unclassified Cryobacterium TaxID=2649013 RepID=UPI002AB4B7C0|nr:MULTISPECIES: FtsX-like permease family protein [unclassified Cryobacterium]MDY7543467.1 FtsX-like permease family protein [Cryobacterium sp. 5B3]MEA9999525.1 FtsX-like permease family protein [Cryobacterium sp. RTS3]MEB0267026.1 FtsX-like permease family protein [Cryobacterium sp. 10I5]MEB0274644.1 FtsX-like permease family protein [Cryobacterium sp. 5B3]